MAQKNSINNKSTELTLDPGASGDSFVQFDINTTGEFRIGVDDTDDSFRISQGSALGTSDTFVMTAAGENTRPLTPAFLAYLGSTVTSVTGDGTVYTMAIDTEVFDQGADYNTGTFTFTAPVTGRYMLIVGADFLADTADGGGDGYLTTIVTSNRSYLSQHLPSRALVTNFFGPSNILSYPMGALTDMDAADTATVTIASAGGTKDDDVGGGNVNTFFAGYLAV